jgi:F-type H+-transporting ATPase subunit gamma
MPSLKDLRVRIKSVKSTQKITSAMKMVAAAKLRRAQEQAESARPYADRMARMLESLAAAYEGRPDAPPLLAGTGKNAAHLVIVATSDRGLCGGFNSGVVREARRFVRELLADRKDVKILCIGRKGRDQLKRDFGARIVGTVEDIGKPRLAFAAAEAIQKRVLAMFEAGEFDTATVIYSRFKSAISQIVTRQRLIPLPVPAAAEGGSPARVQAARATYEYEPGEEELLADLLTRNLAVQLFRALLESWASEQGARMTAMDNATRNAGDMIDGLTLFYNRTRQAYITRELIEIISGAEAL